MVHNSRSYSGARHDLIKYLKSPKKVLDIGCNSGNTGKLIKDTFGQDVVVHGVDYNDDLRQEVESKIDKFALINLNELRSIDDFLGEHIYDSIIIGDVLEHILYPIKVVEKVASHLTSQGNIFISLPNTGYYSSLFNFLRHKWPRNNRGIYDKTHINIYMKGNLHELCPDNYQLNIIRRKYRCRESKGSKWDVFLHIFDIIPYFRNFITFQFLIKISKN